VVIGQKLASSEADVQLLAGISSRHAEIVRSDDDYFITARRPTQLNGKRVEHALLGHGDQIGLGRAVTAKFRIPSKMTPSAVLSFGPDARLSDDVRDVVLMANALIMSPRSSAHVRLAGARGEAALFFRGQRLFCQSEDGVEVDDGPQARSGEVFPGSRVAAGGLSFSIEVSP